MKYWYERPGMRYGPKASSCTPYLPKESSSQYRFMVWKWLSACGLLRKSRRNAGTSARGMSCASCVGMPNTVVVCGSVIEYGLSEKSVRTRATFHCFTDGYLVVSE